ncbi:MAG TPA: tetratricopeptide repeat protein, partial [Bryobacteraceae bacterium]|nr:tetratricopeptide repeat protein [Bryobacteraceae bacterium]
MTLALKSWRPVLSAALLTVGLCGCFLSTQQKEARFLDLGKQQYAKKDYARAIIEFRNAARIAPSDAEAYYQLGLAYAANNDPLSAYISFKKATELNPKHTEAQLKLAALMMFSGKKAMREDAEQRVRNVVGAEPASAEALNLLAFSELRLGEEENAIGHLQQALSKFPA